MSKPTNHPEAPGGERWRLPFGLRTLFVVTTVLGVFCGIVFRLPERLAVAVSLCLLVPVPVVLTVVLIHGRGYARTFSLGALFPAGLMFLSLLLSEYGFDVLVWEAIDDYLSWDDHRLVLCVFLGVYSGLVVGHGRLVRPCRCTGRQAARGTHKTKANRAIA